MRARCRRRHAATRTTSKRFSTLRADFLAGAFLSPLEDIAGDFERRDRTPRGHLAFDRVSLWFEHDLHDQPQLLQILAFCHGEQQSARLHLIQAEDYLGRHRRTMTSLERQAYLDAPLRLTDAGRAVLRGQADHAAINRIDHWLGGIHLVGGALWRWHQEAGCPVAPS